MSETATNRSAYLVSEYDAPSHTFVRREVQALRRMGREVCTYSIRQVSPDYRNTVDTALGQNPLRYLVALFASLFADPGAFFAMWRLSLSHRPPGLRALLWSQFHFIEAAMIARFMRRDRVERLHVHFANSGASVALLACGLCKVPFSLTLHGISETDFPAGLLLREKIERAQFVACASHFMRAQAMRIVDPVHWAKMHVVRCGVDLGKAPDPIPPKTQTGKVRFVCVGRLSPEKGYHGLFPALGRLKAAGLDFSLDVVGSGPSHDAVLEIAEQSGVMSETQFKGFLPEDQTLATIAAADVLILPSLMEGLPVVLIEAMMMEKPVIAPQLAGIPELVKSGENGLMFTPSDWSDLERVISQCIHSRAQWSQWGKAGAQRVAREFTIEVSAQRMAMLLSGQVPDEPAQLPLKGQVGAHAGTGRENEQDRAVV